jgi:hypothetical protein
MTGMRMQPFHLEIPTSIYARQRKARTSLGTCSPVPVVCHFRKAIESTWNCITIFPCRLYGYVKWDCASNSFTVADACHQLDTFSNVGNVRHITIDKDAFNYVGRFVSGRKLFCRLLTDLFTILTLVSDESILSMALMSFFQNILCCGYVNIGVFFPKRTKRFLYLDPSLTVWSLEFSELKKSYGSYSSTGAASEAAQVIQV